MSTTITRGHSNSGNTNSGECQAGLGNPAAFLTVDRDPRADCHWWFLV